MQLSTPSFVGPTPPSLLDSSLTASSTLSPQSFSDPYNLSRAELILEEHLRKNKKQRSSLRSSPLRSYAFLLVPLLEFVRASCCVGRTEDALPLPIFKAAFELYLSAHRKDFYDPEAFIKAANEEYRKPLLLRPLALVFHEGSAIIDFPAKLFTAMTNIALEHLSLSNPRLLPSNSPHLRTIGTDRMQTIFNLSLLPPSSENPFSLQSYASQYLQKEEVDNLSLLFVENQHLIERQTNKNTLRHEHLMSESAQNPLG